MSTTSAAVHPVDEVLPFGQMFAVGLQHVLVMYAGAIAVPLILGGALKLPKDQIAFLINADLFACGIEYADLVGAELRESKPAVVGHVAAPRP